MNRYQIYALTAFLSVAAAFAGAPVSGNEQLNAELFSAIRNGSTTAIQSALDQGAGVNAVDPSGTPALTLAIVYCDARVVRMLLQRGADPNRRSESGGSPLIIAAGDLEKVKALVEKGADVNAASGMGRTPLLAAAGQRDSFAIVKYLLDKGADPKARDGSDEFLTRGKNATTLMLAARSHDVRTLNLLLERGVDVNAAGSTGATALTEAISVRNVDAVRALLKNGAKVNYAFGPIGMTPLIWASFQECPDIVGLLLAAGAGVNAKDQLGSTALVWASMSERDDAATVSALLRAGASTGVTTAMQETPLSWAKRRGNTEIVRLLEQKIAGGNNAGN